MLEGTSSSQELACPDVQCLAEPHHVSHTFKRICKEGSTEPLLQSAYNCLVQEAEKNGAASGGEPAGKQAAEKLPKGKQSQTQPKQLDPGAYPGKESVGFFREYPHRLARSNPCNVVTGLCSTFVLQRE